MNQTPHDNSHDNPNTDPPAAFYNVYEIPIERNYVNETPHDNNNHDTPNTDTPATIYDGYEIPIERDYVNFPINTYEDI